jgi:hypothetical protein
MSEFKYGDMVEVRDEEGAIWREPRFYLGSVPLPNGGVRHYTMYPNENESNFEGTSISWNYIRKPEPAPECELTIEERLERLEKLILKLNNNE